MTQNQEAQPVALRNCPFCGGEGEERWHVFEGGGVAHVVACRECGAEAKHSLIRSESRDNWNRRAAPTADQVEVKALEWVHIRKEESDAESDEAETPFGGYVITTDPFSYSPVMAYYVDGPNWFKGQFASVAEAKAAAQADYETRIRSALRGEQP